MSDLTDALRALSGHVACHSRDWGEHRRDAVIYGIVCGWDPETPDGTEGALAELQERFGWTAEDVATVRRFRAAYITAGELQAKLDLQVAITHQHMDAEQALLESGRRLMAENEQLRAELARLSDTQNPAESSDDYAAGWNACLKAVSLTVPVTVLVGQGDTQNPAAAAVLKAADEWDAMVPLATTWQEDAARWTRANNLRNAIRAWRQTTKHPEKEPHMTEPATYDDLTDHGHPDGECCDETDCRQAWEMYPDG